MSKSLRKKFAFTGNVLFAVFIALVMATVGTLVIAFWYIGLDKIFKINPYAGFVYGLVTTVGFGYFRYHLDRKGIKC